MPNGTVSGVALSPCDLLQGRYRVGPPLGQGGMGAVFQAREEPTGAELTVKQLRLDGPDLLDSFRGEFALLSQVSAPNLLRVLDFGSERLRGELHHYYVADRVDGVTLGEWAPRAASADLLRAVGDAVTGLAALHDAGIRHGDFTPANVLVDRSGQGVLIDLGCARPFGMSKQLAGTPRYLAPELLDGRAGDGRSDLFAVGRTLESLFGATTRAPANVTRLIERLLRAEPGARPRRLRRSAGGVGPKAAHTPEIVGSDAAFGARERGAELRELAFRRWLRVTLGRACLGCGERPAWGSSRLLRGAHLARAAARERAARSAGSSRLGDFCRSRWGCRR